MPLIIQLTVASILFLSFPVSAWSQDDQTTNSFEESYKKSNPTLNYKYDSAKQTHDYSNNWDLDKDGKSDQVYFVGTGGAHLYYYLRVILSTDNVTRNYTFIESDLPVLPPNDKLKNPDFNPLENHAFFAVFDKDLDNNTDIFVRLDNASFESNKKALKKKGIGSPLVLISFKKGKAVFSGFVDQ